MEEIILSGITKHANTISYSYDVSAGLAKYFTQKRFLIEYPENIESVPDAVAAIPFVSNVLPVIWLTDSKLILEALDEDFYHCIPEVKKGYETMFPENSFLGEIAAKKIVKSERTPESGKCAMFFSGGLDSTYTLISHLDEHPVLLSIWGSDIKYENESGWKLVHKAIEETARSFHLDEAVFHSAFREFDNEGELDRTFHQQLKDGWWHGIKHALGMLGHVAPCAYLHGLSVMYIAASHCPASWPVRCASNPMTDNLVRFAGCRVVHDGFEADRQDKAGSIVEFCRETGEPIPLHVCWESQKGSNCCRCEKCYRTMVGLLAEGADPKDYGFADARRYFPRLQGYLAENHSRFAEPIASYWLRMQQRIRKNQAALRGTPYWSSIKWLLKADLAHPETLRMPLPYRARRKLSRSRLGRALRRYI